MDSGIWTLPSLPPDETIERVTTVLERPNAWCKNAGNPGLSDRPATRYLGWEKGAAMDNYVGYVQIKCRPDQPGNAVDNSCPSY